MIFCFIVSVIFSRRLSSNFSWAKYLTVSKLMRLSTLAALSLLSALLRAERRLRLILVRKKAMTPWAIMVPMTRRAYLKLRLVKAMIMTIRPTRSSMLRLKKSSRKT